MSYFHIDFNRKLGDGKWNKNTKFPFIKEKTIDVWIPKLEGEEYSDNIKIIENTFEKYTLTTTFEKGWTNVELFNRIYDIFHNKFKKDTTFKLCIKNTIITNPNWKKLRDPEDKKYIYLNGLHCCDFNNLYIKNVIKYDDVITNGQKFEYVDKGYRVEIDFKNWKKSLPDKNNDNE
jgi:hypothetical protein